jgi:SAM-dependent methyltransferase
MVIKKAATEKNPAFENPFRIEDVVVFDDETLRRMLDKESFGLTIEHFAYSVQGTSEELVWRIQQNLPAGQHSLFMQAYLRPISMNERTQARRQVLDALFWELTYWKTPDLYEELIAGERLHPGIFRQLETDVRGKTLLDVGAGSGRATFESLRHGARFVYAVEPSPGLLHILEQKLANLPGKDCVEICSGRFDAIPLPDQSVDFTLSCSAFMATPEQGGEPGLAEMRRVTRPSGKIVLIWPRVEDYDWLKRHGFHHVTIPLHEEMYVRFRSLQSALRCARLFYAHNKAVARYLLTKRQPQVPFSVLGVNPPHDYSWLEVK